MIERETEEEQTYIIKPVQLSLALQLVEGKGIYIEQKQTQYILFLPISPNFKTFLCTQKAYFSDNNPYTSQVWQHE